MMKSRILASEEAGSVLVRLGVKQSRYQGGTLKVSSPIDGSVTGELPEIHADEVSDRILAAQKAFRQWRKVPAPKRGELVRLFGNELRAAREDLGYLVSLETGKILSEGIGEVQEMIDICDFSVGLSRQLYGLTMATERAQHRMMENWHPAGVVGVVSAFNFPVAVWSWNAAVALVCGNSLVWKPSEKAPLTALACQALFERAVERYGDAPANLSTVLIGGRDVGEALVGDPRLAVISATGSTRMGRQVAPRVAERFGRSILELGGNNGAIVCPSADLELTLRGIAFAAMGTAGQRCTTLRRVFVHEDIADKLIARLKKTYLGVNIGDPRDENTLIGPLRDRAAYESMQKALKQAEHDGAKITGGERVLQDKGGDVYYVRPALVEVAQQFEIMRCETFAPILYVQRYRDFHEAVQWHNDVPQGLSSSIFSNDIREVEYFLSPEGSDAGLVNVNLGPSGAEIGGAFGGEKETGGGRVAGSDAWKAYMRRKTNTINYGSELPLAQGVKFDVE